MLERNAAANTQPARFSEPTEHDFVYLAGVVDTMGTLRIVGSKRDRRVVLHFETPYRGRIVAIHKACGGRGEPPDLRDPEGNARKRQYHYIFQEFDVEWFADHVFTKMRTFRRHWFFAALEVLADERRGAVIGNGTLKDLNDEAFARAKRKYDFELADGNAATLAAESMREQQDKCPD